MESYFSIDRFFQLIPKIVPQLSVTFSIVAVSMVIGTVLAVFVALSEIKKIPILHSLIRLYVSFMRGTPLLVQMMILYYGLPAAVFAVCKINISSWSTIIFVDIAFILNEAAFLGEIFKGAILAVPLEQTEAGYSIGMTKSQTFLHIVLPQTIKMIIPAYGADLIGVFHNTSLVFIIGGVLDVLGKAKTIGVATGHSLEAYLVAALIYVSISLIIKLIFDLVNQRLKYEKEW